MTEVFLIDPHRNQLVHKSPKKQRVKRFKFTVFGSKSKTVVDNQKDKKHLSMHSKYIFVFNENEKLKLF